MSKRKSNSAHARMVRYSRAMLHRNRVAVLDIEHRNLHTMINCSNATLITTNARRALVDALCDIPHPWTIYLAGLHRPDNAEPYMKSEELSLGGIYLAESLVDVIEPRAKALQAVCNPDHFIGMAWIAMPYEASLTEAQAERVFDAFGAWRKQSEAA
jgi:hypothetical protein